MSRCPAQQDAQPPALKNTWKLYLQACGEGTTSIVIEEFYYDHPIKRYEGIRVAAASIEAGTAATDRAVLETLYHATGGDQWNRKTNWLRDDVPLSQWAGVFTNPQGRVRSLFLSQNQLNGEIPPELGNLSNLETLSLWGNQLSGEIPAALGNLSNLETLSLSFNQLSGSVPPQLGNLSNLKYLRLSYNSLTGCLPASWRNVSFHDLESTGLPFCGVDENDGTGEDEGSNEDDGVAPDRAVLETLYRATGGDGWSRKTNWLRDDVPLSQWAGVFTNDQGRVVGLSLWSNRLRGEIPPELGNLADLETLRLDGNQLSGSIPPEFGNLSNLEDLWLHDNELSGPVPAELGQLTFLKTLNLSGNQLTGCLPASWRDADIMVLGRPRLPFCGTSEDEGAGEDDGIAADLAVLETLYHAMGGDRWDRKRNWLRDDVPLSQWAGVFTNDQGRVVGLSLWGKRLRGEIPAALGNLAHLERLYLNDNELSGLIPVSLGNLSNLKDLRLHNNQLSGAIPSELGNLSNLEILWLDDNQFSGSIPPQLGNLSNLETLWLKNNQLSGPIPTELGQLTFLKSLNLGGNQLTGCLPASWRDADIEDFTRPRIPFCGFNIELVFVDDSFTPAQQDIIRDAAAHWERVIIGDVPDIDHYQQYPLDEWSDFLAAQIQVNDVIDDLRIFVAARDIDGSDGTVALAWPSEIRTFSGLPLLAQIKCDPAVLSGGTEYFYSVMLHEIGHALGFGTTWRYLGLLQNPSLDSAGRVDTYFSGGLARVAFNLAGGQIYTGRKVPVENNPLFGVDVHWREFVFWNELMSSFLWSDDTGVAPLSAITIQALADMGYTVDVSQADPYTLPPVSAKRPVHAADGPPACRVIPPMWAVDPNGQRVRVGE